MLFNLAQHINKGCFLRDSTLIIPRPKRKDMLKMEKKERRVGTTSRGIRCPIIRKGDNLAEIVANSVIEAAEIEGFDLRDRDVIAMTESIVARSQGNYATVDNIAADVKAKLGGGTIGVIFPILSRNRFAICLKGIAKGAKKIVLMLSYPSDEVGNSLATYDLIDAAGINPYSDVLTLERYREVFGVQKLEFTGVDYVQYYADLIKEMGAEVEIIFANQPRTILDYTDCVLNCDIHSRFRTKRLLKKAGVDPSSFGTFELTVRVNADGLYDENHYTTAKELALITAEAMNNPIFCKITSTYKKTVTNTQGDDRLVVNHNKLLKNYDGAIGVKTGYTKRSGRSLVGCAERDGVRLISVTINAPDDWNDHKKLFNLGFSTLEKRCIASKDEISYKIPVLNSDTQYVTVKNKEELSVITPKTAGEITKEVKLPRYLVAPIAEDQIVGEIIYSQDGKVIGKIELYTQNNAEKLKKGLFK